MSDDREYNLAEFTRIAGAAMAHKYRTQYALDLLIRYGQMDGSHHKMWVIDQAVRILLGDRYEEFVKIYEGEWGEDGEPMYTWDEGIAP